ncbi:MAG: hypothetical protein K6C68_05055 [Ruminococcus sp.]|nr:hypothetical protein [Ruminococcus sp.]
MRYARRKSVFFTIMIICCFMLVMLGAISSIVRAEVPGAASPLEYLLKLDGAVSEGNDYGDILSIDGVPIASGYTAESGEYKYCAVSGWSDIVGSPSGGLIYNCRNILLANGSRANLLLHKGNSITTTLHSTGMRTAQEELAEYGRDVNAYICVVLRDGAVLVSQGNNSYPQEAFFDPYNYDDLYVDYCSSRSLKGSTFKPLTLRMLLLNNEALGDEYSLYNQEFKDFNQATVRGHTIINWDSCISGNYLTDEGGGIMSRTLSLSDALQLSANTYVLRHADKFGLENTYRKMTELYSLNKVIHTEINELSVGKVSSERLAYFPWGQDADLSAVEMCQLYNYMTGGTYSMPFYVAGVTKPDGKVIYTAEPVKVREKELDIELRTDILDNALADTFCSYLTKDQLHRFAKLVNSRRVLAKSGTADLAGESVNRVMMLTVLNEDRTKVICSACMCIDHTYDYDIQNSYMIEKLVAVLNSMGIL